MDACRRLVFGAQHDNRKPDGFPCLLVQLAQEAGSAATSLTSLVLRDDVTR